MFSLLLKDLNFLLLFNILPKLNHTSMTKFLAAFLWTGDDLFKQHVLILGLPKILWENADFVFLIKSRVTRKSYLASVVFHELCLGKFFEPMEYIPIA